jgi:hypothetical protein
VIDFSHSQGNHSKFTACSSRVDCILVFCRYKNDSSCDDVKKKFRNRPVSIRYVSRVHSNVGHKFLSLHFNTTFRPCLTKIIHKLKIKLTILNCICYWMMIIAKSIFPIDLIYILFNLWLILLLMRHFFKLHQI